MGDEGIEQTTAEAEAQPPDPDHNEKVRAAAYEAIDGMIDEASRAGRLVLAVGIASSSMGVVEGCSLPTVETQAAQYIMPRQGTSLLGAIDVLRDNVQRSMMRWKPGDESLTKRLDELHRKTIIKPTKTAEAWIHLAPWDALTFAEKLCGGTYDAVFGAGCQTPEYRGVPVAVSDETCVVWR